MGALTLVERDVPKPAPGQVLVRIHAASLNNRDLQIARGSYQSSALRYPLVPLSDGAGEVVELGAGVTHLKPRDRVAGAFFQSWIQGPFDAAKAGSALGGGIDGVLSEYVVLEEAAAVKFPELFTYEEAATLPCAGVTAWVGLVELGGLERGDSVLAMGSGGVGIFALQLAKSAGAFAILTSSSDDKLTRGQQLGADAGINYLARPDWDVRARELTAGQGVDHILEVGGKVTLPTSLRAVRDGGHLSLVGSLTGEPGDPRQALQNDRNIRIDSVYVGNVRHFERLNDALQRSGVHPVIDRVYELEEARQAYEYLESGRHFGKVVIRV